MVKMKCSLCGGKLNNNRCTFCGLDNSIYDRDHSYRSAFAQQRRLEKRAERTHMKPASHAGSYAQPQQLRSPAPKPVQAEPLSAGTHAANYNTVSQRSRKRTTPPPASSGSKKFGCAVWIVLMIIILFTFVPALGRIGSSVISQIKSSISDMGSDVGISSDDTSADFDYDPYAFVNREIPGSGETYDTVLGSGVYKVGVHIPEGVYSLKLVEGSGSVEFEEEENSIYDYAYLGTEEEYDQVVERSDFRLYNGGELTIGSGVLVNLSTSNAQPLTQEPSANPLTESISLPVGSYTSGTTIPEGIYDISVEEETDDAYGYASIAMKYPNGNSHYLWADGLQYAVSSGGITTAGVKNVLIPSGTQIEVEYGNIVLTPSEEYYEADYSDYYQ